MNRKLKNSSIKDIAREAGVAISTVSNVMNKKRFVKKKTRDKVLKAIKKLNYRPNIIARGLRTKSTRAIGVIVPDIGNPFFSQVIKGMEEIAVKRQYTLILGCTFYSKYEEERQMNILLDQFIDGLIFFCGYNEYEHIKRINDQNIPVVLVDREIDDHKIPSVLIDNKLAMEAAVEYLCKFGHKKIGYITFSFKNQTTVKNRYIGYCNGLKKNNISYYPEFVLIDESIRLEETKGTYNIIKRFLKRKVLPTAFIVSADIFAYGLIKALKEEGYNIPGDISIIGFDNIVFSEFVDPPLTTVKQPKKEMGLTAMNLLLDIVEEKKVRNKNITLPTKIIERGSVGILLRKDF